MRCKDDAFDERNLLQRFRKAHFCEQFQSSNFLKFAVQTVRRTLKRILFTFEYSRNIQVNNRNYPFSSIRMIGMVQTVCRFCQKAATRKVSNLEILSLASFTMIVISLNHRLCSTRLVIILTSFELLSFESPMISWSVISADKLIR